MNNAILDAMKDKNLGLHEYERIFEGSQLSARFSAFLAGTKQTY